MKNSSYRGEGKVVSNLRRLVAGGTARGSIRDPEQQSMPASSPLLRRAGRIAPHNCQAAKKTDVSRHKSQTS